MSNQKTITVAVTGLNNIDSPGPGVSVIRGIKDSGLNARIIGLAYENLEPGIYMPGLVDKTYLIPFPSTGSEAFIDRLAYINEKEGLDIIIPNFDSELYLFIKYSDQLLNMGIHTFLPTLKQFEERHKDNLPEYGEKYGIKMPVSKAIQNSKELSNLPKPLSYPYYIKGKFYEAFKVNNNNQAVSYFNRLSAKWGLPVVVQQAINGTEVNVIVLGDGEGNTVSAVAMRKQYITDKGKAWGGITINDERLLEITHDIIKKTKWRGAMELEMIKTDEGEYYLIEINPRIPAWVYLAVGAGQNIPEMVCRLAMGEKVIPVTEYEYGKMFIRYSWDLIGDISDFEKIIIFGEL
ncbi:ATP-grasp domain-containing protein [Polaribacter sp. Hel1_85]|uniref:ATP-grasp domain-containing protein n=1 Tax=Polaribacter sp. Hel1_85 TaxID=1250005 RepID=UPI00052D0AE2|nr:ATP-grasp domain-containing protein [Polaribacter sp. Hel1_85]KGL64009.1 biotin carboxylase like protein [Polaribacter sp. Hel1_85]